MIATPDEQDQRARDLISNPLFDCGAHFASIDFCYPLALIYEAVKLEGSLDGNA